jgi:hypothetical protein
MSNKYQIYPQNCQTFGTDNFGDKFERIELSSSSLFIWKQVKEIH